jgi:protein-S-isoprenylcysteine O-methyltransferase Ste14
MYQHSKYQISSGELPVNLPLIWTVLFCLWVVLELWVAVVKRASASDARGKDRGSKLVLWVTIAGSLTVSGFLRARGVAPMPAPEDALKVAAILTMVAGLVLRLTAILSLGSSFTGEVATRSDQRLYRGGLYGVVRHPSYLGMLIIFLAIGVHARDWVCLAAVLVPTTVALLYRIQVEETALRGLFGSAYDDYSRTTRRLIPGIY